MSQIKPNYIELGFANSMGPQLRIVVEQQLVEDLKFYGIQKNDLRFDWSDSCIEGHNTHYLDGSVENFSGIAVFDSQDNLLADGWMEFIHQHDFFLAYWEYVTTWNNESKLAEKKHAGIPEHIWKQVPDDIKPQLESKRIKQNPWIGK